MIKRLTVAALLLAAAGSAVADPGYYVVTAYDNEGEKSLDFRYWTVKLPGSPAVLWPEVGFSLGVNSRWTTELYLSTIGTMDTAFKPSTLNWQNDYLLTQGQYPVDVAVHTNLIRARDPAEGWALEFGPALQTDIGRTQLNANVFFERSFRAAVPAPTQLKYQWQAKYRWSPAWQLGLQGFGELGPWDHWSPSDQQSHRAGPAVFGQWPLGGHEKLRYQAAYLSGGIYGFHGHMFTMRVQYVY